MAVEVVVGAVGGGAGRVAWLACDAPLAVIPAGLHHVVGGEFLYGDGLALAVDFGDDAFTGLGVAPFGLAVAEVACEGATLSDFEGLAVVGGDVVVGVVEGGGVAASGIGTDGGCG